MGALDLGLYEQSLREPLEDAARFSGTRIMPFKTAKICRPWVPQDVFHYARDGDLPLLSYLRKHGNKPSGPPCNPVHDDLRDDIWAYPECAGFPSDVHSYREVELLLRPETQLYTQLSGAEIKTLLTVVDNIIYESEEDRLSLIGVISCDYAHVREREIKPLRHAARFFAYNWGLVPDLYLALPAVGEENMPWLLPIDSIKIRKRYLSVFK